VTGLTLADPQLIRDKDASAMSEPRYKIVFAGALQPGVDLTTAKLNLAALFKSDVAAIERLFNGSTVALKRDLTYSDAQTYLQALNKTGIVACAFWPGPWS
jgi:hypothetical protein